jgi:hypothetical protein
MTARYDTGLRAAPEPDQTVRKKALESAHPDLRIVTPDNGWHWIAAWLRVDGTEDSAGETHLARLLDIVEPALAARGRAS